jgi:hypothetical protein
VARSRIYTVHVRMWSASADREAVFVREGFSWGAFFFSVLWALWHRMWFAALIVFAVSVALSLLTELLGVDDMVSTVIGAAFALIVAWEANDWRRRALDRRGYVNAGIVAAPDLVEAERRFFAKPVPGQTSP